MLHKYTWIWNTVYSENCFSIHFENDCYQTEYDTWGPDNQPLSTCFSDFKSSESQIVIAFTVNIFIFATINFPDEMSVHGDELSRFPSYSH